MKLLPVGFGNWVTLDRIVAIANFNSAPIKRLVRERKGAERLINVTGGKRAKTVLISDTGFIILTAISSETLLSRFEQRRQQSIPHRR